MPLSIASCRYAVTRDIWTNSWFGVHILHSVDQCVRKEGDCDVICSVHLHWRHRMDNQYYHEQHRFEFDNWVWSWRYDWSGSSGNSGICWVSWIHWIPVSARTFHNISVLNHENFILSYSISSALIMELIRHFMIKFWAFYEHSQFQFCIHSEQWNCCMFLAWTCFFLINFDFVRFSTVELQKNHPNITKRSPIDTMRTLE